MMVKIISCNQALTTAQITITQDGHTVTRHARRNGTKWLCNSFDGSDRLLHLDIKQDDLIRFRRSLAN